MAAIECLAMASTAMTVENSVRLVADRLVLREFREDDWVLVHRYWSDQEVGRYMPRGVLNEEGAKSLVQKALAGQRAVPRRYFRLATTLKESGLLIGDCVCRVADPENMEDLSRIIGQAYIGFFFDRQYWGQGYATEVARALLEFGFTRLGLERIFAWCDAENLASARVLQKVGMKLEGHLRKSVLTQGKWRDCFIFGILKDEWESPLVARGST